MRYLSNAIAALMLVMTASCGGGGPTEQDIHNSLSNTLSSVSGPWIGFTSPPGSIALDFQLQEGANGLVSGTGTTKEGSTLAAVPITVSGTFNPPVLTLNFDGMVFETHAVKGTAQGSYTTVGGIAATLKLTAPGYSRDIPIILQEK